MAAFWPPHGYYGHYPVYGGPVYAPPPAYPPAYPPMQGGTPLTASSKWPKLNTLLSAGETLVRFDVRKHPREAILMNAYHHYGLQPAIISGAPVTYLRFYSKSIPWCIDIKANERSVITCRDVWDAIYDALQQEIDDSEWGMIVRDKKLRETVENAVKKRKEGSKKIKRIDFLGEETMFKGLEKQDDLAKVRLLPGTEGCEETWFATFSA